MSYALKLSDLVGLVGSIIIVSLYYLNLRGRVDATGLFYPVLNLVGCALIMVSLVYDFNAPSLFIEIFWSSVSVYGIVSYLRRRCAGRRDAAGRDAKAACRQGDSM